MAYPWTGPSADDFQNQQVQGALGEIRFGRHRRYLALLHVLTHDMQKRKVCGARTPFRALRAERIQPPQIWKAAEIMIRGCQRGPVLNRQRGKNGVRYQRTDCTVVADKFFQNFCVAWSRVQRNDARLPQPFANNRKCILGRSRIRPDS